MFFGSLENALQLIIIDFIQTEYRFYKDFIPQKKSVL